MRVLKQRGGVALRWVYPLSAGICSRAEGPAITRLADLDDHGTASIHEAVWAAEERLATSRARDRRTYAEWRQRKAATP